MARVHVHRNKGDPLPTHIQVLAEGRQIKLPLQREAKDDPTPRWGDLWKLREPFPHSRLVVSVKGAQSPYSHETPNPSPLCPAGALDDSGRAQSHRQTRGIHPVTQAPSIDEIDTRGEATASRSARAAPPLFRRRFCTSAQGSCLLEHI